MKDEQHRRHRRYRSPYTDGGLNVHFSSLTPSKNAMHDGPYGDTSCPCDEGGDDATPAIPRLTSGRRPFLTLNTVNTMKILLVVACALASLVGVTADQPISGNMVMTRTLSHLGSHSGVLGVVSNDVTPTLPLAVHPRTPSKKRRRGVITQLLTKRQSAANPANTCSCQPAEEGEAHNGAYYAGIIMIPVLVLLSGLFAGLTLGYMSLDINQLQVIARTGTPKQKRDAERIIPLRKNGHLLLVSLLIGNMAASETLPVIADPVLGGGLQAVLVSVVLVIIFAEIIPQSVCSRFGLQIGAAMVWPTRVIIGITFIVSYPISKLLELLLGAHSGVVYRRAELKELINMHGDDEKHGGDLNRDTITIVGATLDLQEKVVGDAMTGLDKAFMLDIDSKLDYATLTKILQSGHSRIPVYEMREVEAGAALKKVQSSTSEKPATPTPSVRKHIVGALLTKQLILLDPGDAVPLRELPMNPLPTVSEVLSLLHILNTFQEGHSHIAMVARSPKPPPSYMRNKRRRRSSGGSSSSDGDSANEGAEHRGTRHLRRFATKSIKAFHRSNTVSTEGPQLSPIAEHRSFNPFKRTDKEKPVDEEAGDINPAISINGGSDAQDTATITDSFDFTVIPDPNDIVGLITLEDVIEELIGEEIEDEFDAQLQTGKSAAEPYIPAEAKYHINNTSGARRILGSFHGLARAKADTTAGTTTGLLAAAAQRLEVSDTPAGRSEGDEKKVSTGQPKSTALSAFMRSTSGIGMGRSTSAPGRKRADPSMLTTPSVPVSPRTQIQSGRLPTASGQGVTSSSNSPAVVVHTSEAVAPSAEVIASESEEGGMGESSAGLSQRTFMDERATSLDVSRDSAEPDLRPIAATDDRPAKPRRTTTMLSDALLLERGRRQLRAQGQDPDALKLRLAPRATTPSGAGLSMSGHPGAATPRLETPDGGAVLLVPPPGQRPAPAIAAAPASADPPSLAATGRKLTFKSPTTDPAVIPVRPAPSKVINGPTSGVVESNAGVVSDHT